MWEMTQSVEDELLRAGTAEQVEKALISGARVGARNAAGDTALHLACMRGNIATANELVGAGAQINVRNKRGDTPLHMACSWRGLPQAIDCMMALGGIADLENEAGYTPLMFALRNGHEDAALTMIEHDIRIESRANNGDTALLLAIQYNQPAAAAALIARGADMEKRSRDGSTALLLAIRYRNPQLCDLMLKYGADYTAERADGLDAFQLALKFNLLNVARFVIEHNGNLACTSLSMEHVIRSGHTDIAMRILKLGLSAQQLDMALVQACQAKQNEIAHLLLAHGARPCAMDDTGRTPLMLSSCRARSINLVEALIAAGADLHVRANSGATALMLACSCGNPSIAKLLLRRGADPNVQDHEGVTALMLASASANCDLVDALLKHGAEINLRTQDGSTALMFACLFRFSATVNLLLERGADPEILSQTGFTALMHACSHGGYEIVNALLSHGCAEKKEKKEKKEKLKLDAALRLACERKSLSSPEIMVQRLQCVQACWSAGADVQAADQRGCTALDVARQSQFGAAVDFLTFISGSRVSKVLLQKDKVSRSAIVIIFNAGLVSKCACLNIDEEMLEQLGIGAGVQQRAILARLGSGPQSLWASWFSRAYSRRRVSARLQQKVPIMKVPENSNGKTLSKPLLHKG